MKFFETHYVKTHNSVWLHNEVLSRLFEIVFMSCAANPIVCKNSQPWTIAAWLGWNNLHMNEQQTGDEMSNRYCVALHV